MQRHKPFHPRRGAFRRNGVKIGDQQVAFKNLHRSFIEYHETYHINQTSKLVYTENEYKEICSLTLDQVYTLKGKKIYKKICHKLK